MTTQPPRTGAPGPRNTLADVTGLQVGHAQDERVNTGVTVIRHADLRPVCAVDVRGGGPGTRETDALAAHTLVDQIDAVVLSGGSVYGLAAADGVAAHLGAQGTGFQLIPAPGAPPSPIVPSAILYDLANGGEKDWGATPPYRDLGAQALQSASTHVAPGRIGAGFGARAGAVPGGVGTASWITPDGFAVAALAAVNSFGAVRMPGSEAFWAWPWEQTWNGAPEFGGARPWDADAPIAMDLEDWGAAKIDPRPRENTTLAVVAANADLTAAECQRIAIMAQDGLARAIRPAHAPFDGDVVFALATGETPAPDAPAARALTVTRLGALAADCLARAIARGVWFAQDG